MNKKQSELSTQENISISASFVVFVASVHTILLWPPGSDPID